MEQSPALTTASEEFLSMSQTGRLLSMLDDNSLLSEDEGEKSLSSIPRKKGGNGDESLGDNSFPDSNNILSQSKQNVMVDLLKEYGLDENLDSHGGDNSTSETKSENISDDDLSLDEDEAIISVDEEDYWAENKKQNALHSNEAPLSVESDEKGQTRQQLQSKIKTVVSESDDEMIFQDSPSSEDKPRQKEPNREPDTSKRKNAPTDENDSKDRPPKVKISIKAPKSTNLKLAASQKGSAPAKKSKQTSSSSSAPRIEPSKNAIDRPRDMELSKKVPSSTNRELAAAPMGNVAGRKNDQTSNNRLAPSEEPSKETADRPPKMKILIKTSKSTHREPIAKKKDPPGEKPSKETADGPPNGKASRKISRTINPVRKVVAPPKETGPAKSNEQTSTNKLAPRGNPSKKTKDAISNAKSLLNIVARRKSESKTEVADVDASVASVESPLQGLPMDWDDESSVEPPDDEASDDDSDSSDDSPVLLIKNRQPSKPAEARPPTRTATQVKIKKSLVTAKSKPSDSSDSDSDSSDDSPILLIRNKQPSPKQVEAQPPGKTTRQTKTTKNSGPAKAKSTESSDSVSDSSDDSPILLIRRTPAEAQGAMQSKSKKVTTGNVRSDASSDDLESKVKKKGIGQYIRWQNNGGNDIKRKQPSGSTSGRIIPSRSPTRSRPSNKDKLEAPARKTKPPGLFARLTMSPVRAKSVSTEIEKERTHTSKQTTAVSGKPKKTHVEPKSVSQLREERRQLVLIDQQRRSTIVIQSALRGHIARRQFGKRKRKAEKHQRSTPTHSSGDTSRAPILRETSYTARSLEVRRGTDSPPASPVQAKPSRTWMPWSKSSTSTPRAAKEQIATQHFDASLYTRKRMYQDEHESRGKSIDEIREARRQMYLRDLERREAIKIQAAFRGYFTRLMLLKDGHEGMGVETSVVPEAFDRSSYVQKRLQQDEEARQTKTVAEIRLERHQIYLRDLQRREATKIQSVMRGHLTRNRYPGLSTKWQTVQTSSRTIHGQASSPKILRPRDAEPEKTKNSWNVLTKMIFGKPDEAPAEQKVEEQEFERFDPYADVDKGDFFGFTHSNYKERNGYFTSTLDKSPRYVAGSQYVSEQARNWTGRARTPECNNNLEQEAYNRERRAREEFELKSMTIAKSNAKKYEAAKEDLKKQEATKLKAVDGSGPAKMRRDLNQKQATRSSKQRSNVGAKRSHRISKHKKEEQGVTRKVPTKKPSVKQIPEPKFIEVKLHKTQHDTQKEKIKPDFVSSSFKQTPESELRKVKLHKIQEKDVKKKEKETDYISSSIKQTPLRNIQQVVQEEEIETDDYSYEEIVEEIIDAQIVPSTDGENKLSEPIESKSKAINTPVILLDHKKEAGLHIGSTYATDVGDSWWLPSVGTEDTRSYRDELYVPDKKPEMSYPRRAPKNSTTIYWEAVRESFLPTSLGGSVDGRSIDDTFSLLPSVARSSQSCNSQHDLVMEPSALIDDESWAPPAESSSTISHAMQDGNFDDQTYDSWVPPPSKPKVRPQRVDFTGDVQKQSSFTWAPHLPSPSKRDKSRVEQIISGDLEAPIDPPTSPLSNSMSVDQEQVTREDAMTIVSETTHKNHMKTTKVMVVVMAIILLLVGGAVAAYFFWEDPPWDE